MIAFILISVELGREEEVSEELKRIGQIRETYPLLETYNLMIKLDVRSEEEILQFLKKLRGVTNIDNTLTLVPSD